MDHEFQMSVTKALHPSEQPLKMKHARSVIIATHRHKGAKMFWNIVTRQPLMEHRFTAWKFCHVLHKVLREGHENCLRHSQVHKTLILEVGKLWGHLQDGVGKCIESYTQLLVNKLDFHQKNLGIPGAITMDFNDIRKITGDDLNNYFQLCVEIFDYLDCIIALQLVIFQALNTYRLSSMTPQGQCRLAPLVTMIQDSNPLYDLCVRVLFRLHDGIPHDILAGHRTRFNELFVKLKLFYESVRPLQYFSDIIQVPHLPDAAPNFSSVHDVGNYIAPVMHVFQQQEEEEIPTVEESLLDLSNASENNASSSPTEPVPQPSAAEEQLEEAQIMITNLQEELRVRQIHIDQLVNITREMSNLQVRNEALEAEVNLTKEMLRNTNQIKEKLEQKLKEMEELEVEVKVGDDKYKQVEEKFDKIKTMYAKLREEHIQLLRVRNDDSKQLMAERKKAEELQTEILALKAKEEDLIKVEQKNVALNDKIKEYEDVITKNEKRLKELEQQLSESKALFEKHDTDKSAIISEYENQLLEQKMELKKFKENYDLEVQTKQHEMQELMHIKSQHENNLQELQQKLQNTTKDKDNLSLKLQEIEKEMLQKIQEVKSQQSETIRNLEDRLQEGTKTNETLNRSLSEMGEQITDISGQLETAKKEVTDLKTSETQTRNMLDNLLSSLSKLLANSIQKDFNFEYLEMTEIPQASKINIQQIHNQLQQIPNEYKSLQETKGQHMAPFMSLYLELSQNFKIFHEHIMLIFSNTTDLNKAEELRLLCNELRQSVTALYKGIAENKEVAVIENISLREIGPKLNAIQSVVTGLENSFSESLNVGDMLQQELKQMDNIIEEATKEIMDLLLNTKSQHEGIKLEVNEKILDSCTNLMQCIMVLIQRSRELQNEIVSTQKGASSVKEFYKRNSQWTEGLISASKSIAKGAKYLVDAANKTIGSDSAECFELIVAAQDIAASTAQLVIASKVKARNDSSNLANLTKASRDVSMATGQVVATVRDGNSKLEYKNEIDISQLTPSQKKTMEMEMQIKVLQLEHSLQSEQQKLMSFRKAFYQSADDD
ncbi:LOW QUALITY PROTEIN: huntington interacting protein related 1 [Musca vetustissima]|uniref:LOW QUALITY PROTEIN: huntington interacting protein related 1 n=1 Tax=Musca vetustissima TaxID=27455 RepID=UPI002AB6C287|nr:LOW QUALITY PROTEIN: huntington interacting protein related 1 [Musca vetustissima]